MAANIRQPTIHDASGIAKVHVDSWRTTYSGIVPQEYLDSLDYAARTAAWRDQLARAEAHFLIAEDAGVICGFICGGKVREPISTCDAEIYAIYLLVEYQNRGIGRNLMRNLAKSLMQIGFRSLAVWVLEKNPACGFYARLGGERLAEKPIEIGGAQLIEVAYGWKSIHDVVQPEYPSQ